MKIVLDTNVVIAAFAARGLCHDVLEVCLTEHEIILSEHILSEINANLTKKIKLPKNIVMNIIDYLNTEALIVSPVNVPPSICRDCNDLPVIGAAIAGKVKIGRAHV